MPSALAMAVGPKPPSSALACRAQRPTAARAQLINLDQATLLSRGQDQKGNVLLHSGGHFRSRQLTLWNQMGSRVIRGNLLVIPIEDSLLYVSPLYLRATQGHLPELKRVIAAYGEHVVMKETLAGRRCSWNPGPRRRPRTPQPERCSAVRRRIERGRRSTATIKQSSA